jgi:enoyl-CoA hydratase
MEGDFLELEYFLYECEGGVAVLTLNRPEVRNALSVGLQRELMRVIAHVNESDDVRVLIITGAGEKAFAAGSDISAMRDRDMITVFNGIFAKSIRCVADCEKPVIAAVNGAAYGGGCELALAADIRLASENARFALPELGLGLMPGGGGTQRLAKLVGVGRAKEIILTGRAVDAEEALRIGLVTGVCPLEKLMSEAKAVASKLLEKGPLSLRLAKKVANLALSADEASAIQMELYAYCMLIASEDSKEGVNAFLEKRKPDFQGK